MSLSKNMVKGVLLVSTGVLAGLGLTLNYVGVPAVLATSDPLPSWKMCYNRGKNIAFSTIGSSVASALYIFYKGGMKEGKLSYLLIAGLSFSIVPYTLIVMAPVNNTLFRLENDENSKEEARKQIMKWGKLQLVRTAFGFSAFLTSAYIIFD